MRKVNFNTAIETARMIILPSEGEMELTVEQASNKIAGQILMSLSNLHGAPEDEYYDAFIVKHWAQTAEMLEKLVREKDLSLNDKVSMKYNEKTDMYEVH